MAHVARVTVKGLSPYSQSRQHYAPKEQKETHDDYEKRTWREKAHIGADGFMFIPPMAFKKAIAEAAKRMSIKIPGKGKQTYSKNFNAGILIIDPLILPVKKEDMLSETLPQDAQGRKGSGGGTRVLRTFPIVHEWGGEVIYHILDDTITEDIFTQTVIESGNFIGIGRFRPENGGYYGRFEVKSVAWD